MTLQQQYAGDPKLLAFCEIKLLVPGWAGLLTPAEARFIQQVLFESSTLRRRWRIRGKRPHLSTIAEKACPEEPKEACRQLDNALARGYYRKARRR